MPTQSYGRNNIYAANDEERARRQEAFDRAGAASEQNAILSEREKNNQTRAANDLAFKQAQAATKAAHEADLMTQRKKEFDHTSQVQDRTLQLREADTRLRRIKSDRETSESLALKERQIKQESGADAFFKALPNLDPLRPTYTADVTAIPGFKEAKNDPVVKHIFDSQMEAHLKHLSVQDRQPPGLISNIEGEKRVFRDPRTGQVITQGEAPIHKQPELSPDRQAAALDRQIGALEKRNEHFADSTGPFTAKNGKTYFGNSLSTDNLGNLKEATPASLSEWKHYSALKARRDALENGAPQQQNTQSDEYLSRETQNKSPTVAPAANPDHESTLNAARAAVASGKDPAAVRKRLQDNGIDPSGL